MLTWCPFRLQFYLNGHQQLAAVLRRRGIAHILVDHAFVEMTDWARAQQIADTLDVQPLHATLDRVTRTYCPVVTTLGPAYHWSLMQVEYATDLVFKTRADVAPLYDALVRTAIHAVKPDHVATFLGQRLTPACTRELGSDFTTRIFKHHRQVEQHDGTTCLTLAPLRKTIYSLQPDLRQLLTAANQRYLAFLSDLDDPTPALKALDRITQSTEEQGRRYKGFKRRNWSESTRIPGCPGNKSRTS